MKPEHKKYILDNINIKSVSGLSRELGVKQKKILAFLASRKNGRAEPPTGAGAEPRGRLWIVFASIALIIMIGSAVYANSLDNEFIWDDDILITDNKFIRDLRNIPQFFTKDIAYKTADKSNFYRPLQTLSCALTYAVWKLNPKPYHAANAVFHILAALMLYWLIKLVSKSDIISLLAALLFVSHPIHTEAVTYVSGRADPMAAFFILLMTVSYVKHSKTNSVVFYLLSIISLIMALMSKEIAIMAPFLIAAYDWVYKNRLPFKKELPFFAVLFIYIALRKTLLYFPLKATAITETTFLQRLPAIFSYFTLYFKKLALPFDLHMEYQLNVPLMANPAVIFGIALAAGLFLTAAFNRQKEKFITFSIAWFFINYLPVSNVYPLNSFFAEHWIYAPSMGVFMLAGWAVAKAAERKKAFKGLAALSVLSLLFFFGRLTINQNLYWKDTRLFYERTIRYNPESARLYYRLSLWYFLKERYDEGIEIVKKAIELNPEYVDARINLAHAYLLKGENDKTIEECRRILKIEPDSVLGHLNLGAAYSNKGRIDEAIVEYKAILSLDPYNAEANNNLAVAYYLKKEQGLAAQHCDRALELGFNVKPELLKALNKDEAGR